MTLPTDSAHKGAEIEEWIDLHFFRPIGIRIARVLYPTRISPDQVTLIALVIGLAAGHLMFYRSAWLNAAGVGLFIISDFFDSADGQLARLRGTSTRFGRMLDGISDNARFVNLYLHLAARILLTRATPLGMLETVALVLLAGLSHSMQSTIADFIRQVYLFVADGGEGELDLPEDVAVTSGPGLFDRLQIGIYRGYVERQATACPRSIAVVRRIRQGGSSEEVAARWGHVQLGTVRACALIGQNIRFLLLALTVVPGWPEGFLWITLVPLNLVLLVLLRRHESRVTELARTGDLPSIPLAGVA